MSQKPYVSEVTISLVPDVIEIVGAVYPPTVTDDSTKLVSVCPGCENVHKVDQFYQCPDVKEHTFRQGELDKAKKVGDDLIRLSPEEAKNARTSELPKNVLDLNVHRLEDIQGRTMQAASTGYVFRPKEGGKFYGVLIDLLEKRPDLVLMGHMNLRDTDKLMRLTRGLNGQLLLTELMWPEEVDVYPAPVYEYKDSLLDVAEQLLEKQVSVFDPDEYKKVAKERILALVEARASGAPAPVKVMAKDRLEDDDALENLLLAAIGQ